MAYNIIHSVKRSITLIIRVTDVMRLFTQGCQHILLSPPLAMVRQVLSRFEVSTTNSDAARHRSQFCGLFHALSVVMPSASSVTMSLGSAPSILRISDLKNKAIQPIQYLYQTRRSHRQKFQQTTLYEMSGSKIITSSFRFGMLLRRICSEMNGTRGEVRGDEGGCIAMISQRLGCIRQESCSQTCEV